MTIRLHVMLRLRGDKLYSSSPTCSFRACAKLSLRTILSLLYYSRFLPCFYPYLFSLYFLQDSWSLYLYCFYYKIFSATCTVLSYYIRKYCSLVVGGELGFRTLPFWGFGWFFKTHSVIVVWSMRRPIPSQSLQFTIQNHHDCYFNLGSHRLVLYL